MLLEYSSIPLWTYTISSPCPGTSACLNSTLRRYLSTYYAFEATCLLSGPDLQMHVLSTVCCLTGHWQKTCRHPPHDQVTDLTQIRLKKSIVTCKLRASLAQSARTWIPQSAIQIGAPLLPQKVSCNPQRVHIERSLCSSLNRTGKRGLSLSKAQYMMLLK